MPSDRKSLKAGWRRSPVLPLGLLLLALATLFLFGSDRGHFYRSGHHGWNSSKILALAENLSTQHSFARFHRLTPDQDGNSEPSFLYNRFPIGGYLLIKLALLPFGDGLSAKILAGRMLMLACFAAAAVLAYLALGRITGSRWIACTATGLAFSSYYCLYYSDMISTEVAVDLFAVMLVFHGMAIFVQEDRFRQLLVKTCIALALGWHVYALLLPFIAFSLASELISAHRAAAVSCASPLSKIKRFSAVLLLGRPFALGLTALAFGLLALSFNLLSDYYALNGTTPITESPTWQSMMRRMGQDQELQAAYYERLRWPNFLQTQFQILGITIFPYSLPGYIDALRLDDHASAEALFEDMFPFGVTALAICLVWLCFTRQKILLATLTLSGFFWSIPMRSSVVFHDFEGAFYVGVPLTLFSLVLLHMRKLSGERLMARFAVAALLVLVFSNWQMNRVDQEDAAGRAFHTEVMSDFQAIRSQTAGGTIGVMLMGQQPKATGAWWALEYYLAQRVFLLLQYPPKKLEFVDFIVTNWREPEIDMLTPENQRFFLYSQDAYLGQYDTLLGNLLAQDKFDIYQKGNQLIYLRSPCTKADTAARFLLHLLPVNQADLPEGRRQYGFDNFDFTFSQHGVHFETHEVPTCTARVSLPSYGIAKVSTGQFDERGPIWWVDSPLTR